MVTGYEWAANAAVQLDLTSEKGTAKGYCEKIIEVGGKDAVKNAAALKTAYGYLAAYSCKTKDIAKATEYANKILETDPENGNAKAILGGGCN